MFCLSSNLSNVDCIWWTESAAHNAFWWGNKVQFSRTYGNSRPNEGSPLYLLSLRWRCKINNRKVQSILLNQCSRLTKQEVLGRTNRLFYFNTTRTTWKTTPLTILCCRGNVFTELLLSNDIGTHTHASNNSSVVECIHCRGKVFTEPLPTNERRNTIYRAFA
jgi:hypothetical protein